MGLADRTTRHPYPSQWSKFTPEAPQYFDRSRALTEGAALLRTPAPLGFADSPLTHPSEKVKKVFQQR